jgi:hypothetical protein
VLSESVAGYVPQLVLKSIGGEIVDDGDNGKGSILRFALLPSTIKKES